MHTDHFRVMIIVLVSMLLFGCAGNKKLINQKNMQITALEERVDSLRDEMNDIRSEKMTMRDELETKLAEARGDLEVCLEQKDDLLKIKISDAVKFEFGSAKLTTKGRDALDAIWKVLGRYPDRRILIEGHTDDIPIDEDYRHVFRSNWELSTARASAVLHYLVDTHGADPVRLTVSGYGEYHPMADNETPEGRAENRRVVIWVRNETK